MSKILANQIANYGDDAPIEIKEGLNIPAGKPIQAAGSSGSSGQVLSTTGTSIEWVATFDGDYNSLSNKPTIPAAQVASDWSAVSGVSRILNKPIIPAQPSVTTATAGTPSLSYNTVNGEFTYTPPDISDMATETWVGSQGFLTAEVDNLSSVTGRNQVTVTLNGGYGTKNCGSTGNHMLFGGLVIYENDIMNIGVNDRTLFGHRNGAITWCGDDGSGETDWQNRKFELKHLDSSQNTNSFFALAGALYLQATGGYPISIGNDTSTIQLGNNSGSIKYLEASTAGTKLFYDGVEKLTTSLTGIDLGTNTLTTTGKLVYSNNYANAVDLPDASTYHGMFAHVHATGKGVFAHGGSWLSLVDETSSINELADVNTASNSDGYVLKWDAGTSTWKPQPDLVGSGGSGIVLTDLSVTTAAASATPSLSYSNTTGVFTYTPYDPSTYTETDPIFGASAAAGITSSNIANWDAAYGWGNHASAGYLTAVSLSLNGLTDVSFNQANLNSGDGLIWNGTSWTRTTQQYLTSYTETDPVFTASVASSITSTNIDNWNTAYGWGNHASAGYLTTLGINGLSDVTTGTISDGDVLTYDGTTSQWKALAPSGGGGGANVTISDTIPAGTPAAGDLWWESDKGRLKVYYTDTNSSQWVDVNPPLAPALSSDAPVTASSAGSVGDIRYDSGYVYICVATNTWKRAALATW